MGADLYRTKEYQANSSKYEPKFHAAVAERDKLTNFYGNRPDSEIVKKAQKKVSYYYEKMYSVGYYRDSYNNSNLLWQFDLDYWTWFGGLLNKSGNLMPAKAKLVLAEMAKREPIFEQKLAKMSKSDQRYFRAKYRNFRSFLTGAIEANDKIECSI